MNPIGTLVLCHGPATCRDVQNIPFSFYSTSVMSVEINTQGSTHPTRLPISYGPNFPSKKREIKTKKNKARKKRNPR